MMGKLQSKQKLGLKDHIPTNHKKNSSDSHHYQPITSVDFCQEYLLAANSIGVCTFYTYCKIIVNFYLIYLQ